MGDWVKLNWQCRRGMLELDLMLKRYLDNHYQQAEASEKALFSEFLKLEDSEILVLLMETQLDGFTRHSVLIDKIRNG
ncbi:MAG: succinate dehydrogenase assembly factor 2 [Methylococcaceae bacterium]|jgi:antitoxin CptB